MFPTKTDSLIIGAGIHGLSTAYHLGELIRARGQTPDILVLDKAGIAAGASGIACGVVRNNYFQSAMRELMAHSVDIWESDPEAFGYHPVGYMQISPECMREDVAGIAVEQREIGYASTFVEGVDESRSYMRAIFADWQAQGITSVLHEHRGGYANNTKAVYGLAAKAEAVGARILTGVTVTGFRRDACGAVVAVETDRGAIDCTQVVVAVGPWIRRLWMLLDLPASISVRAVDGTVRPDVPMWVYWSLQEGTLGVDPDLQRTNDGALPPVIHVDSDAPLISDEDGSLITEDLWGIYYKPDFHFGGIQGGARPFRIETDPEHVAVDPYGPASPEFIVGPEFAHMWVSALAHCQGRFVGQHARFKREPSGGIGAFSPDSFPVFDRFHGNCSVIADSNHGFKMIGVGKLVAEEMITGRSSILLEPFRMARFATGRVHPKSHSPFPWS